MSYPDSLREVIKHIAFLAGPFGLHIAWIFLGTCTAAKSAVKMSLFQNKIWCRLLIPSKVAGAIIGKGGATIKSLRDEVSSKVSCVPSKNE